MTREKLLATAEIIFGEKGYYETSVVDITQQAGVSQGTFYNYFPTKYAIFEELMMQLSRDVRFEIKKAIASAKSHEEAQRIGFQTFFLWVRNHQNLYSIVQQALLVDVKLYRYYYDRLANGYMRALSKAMEEGEFKSLNKEAITYCLMGIGQFLGMRWVYWEEQSVPDDVFESAMDMIFHGLKQPTIKGDERKDEANFDVD
ncbi:TetR/AcrR family transcriptional regulator [Bacillus sp. REN10]|uniref:TetR/AcrR family transcriptional regulator n=1 Tax=Bacillus sp. REN10 TaxID=2782541 RepID=UPI00193B19EC|nr:TetR/AcrR family transcriptional regulator [Bacillus sp. REN10]